MKLGPFERTFVIANRAFGAICFFAGIGVLATFGWALIRGRLLGEAWITGAIGLALTVAGIAYLKAPLTRWHKK
jgi:hypothetical protein